jgi:hypothetical protein
MLMKYPRPTSAIAKGIPTMIQSMVGNELDVVFVPPGGVVDGLTGTRRLPVVVVWFASPG